MFLRFQRDSFVGRWSRAPAAITLGILVHRKIGFRGSNRRSPITNYTTREIFERSGEVSGVNSRS